MQDDPNQANVPEQTEGSISPHGPSGILSGASTQTPKGFYVGPYPDEEDDSQPTQAQLVAAKNKLKDWAWNGGPRPSE